MDDFRRIQETQRINRIKASNDCLTCEVVITKEFKEAPISIVQDMVDQSKWHKW